MCDKYSKILRYLDKIRDALIRSDVLKVEDHLDFVLGDPDQPAPMNGDDGIDSVRPDAEDDETDRG